MTPSAQLLQKLSRSRLQPRWAVASVGFGERRSRGKGAGMEFADHRAYQAGDDLRHLDPHVFARTGETYVRQYEVHRQLPITILIDASRSMRTGMPDRYDLALQLAAILGFVGLTGGDRVRFGIARAGDVEWSVHFNGVSRAATAFAWLGRERGESEAFERCLIAAARQMPENGLTIVLSDFWDRLDDGIGMLAAQGQEVWGLHLVTRDEIDPSILGEGEVRLVDAETGGEIDLVFDRAVLDQYRQRSESWLEALRASFMKVRGTYVTIPTDIALEHLLLRDWRRQRLIS